MKVWTFVVIGGQPFSLTLPDNPKLDHNGSMTVWKTFCDDGTAASLKEAFTALGATHVTFTTESESAEQKAERASLLDGTWVDGLTSD